MSHRILLLMIGLMSVGCSNGVISPATLAPDNLGCDLYNVARSRVHSSPRILDDTIGAPRDPDMMPTDEELRSIGLAEAIKATLVNNSFVLVAEDLGTRNNQILSDPDEVPSPFDREIRASSVRINDRGVQAALSDFDARWNTVLNWGGDEQIQSNIANVGLIPGQTLDSNTAFFSTRLSKATTTGGSVALFHEWAYERNNAPRLFPSDYRGRLGAEFRQPLWAGAGRDFALTSGPVDLLAPDLADLSQGVVIARINDSISQADFELAVARMLLDVETHYWDLWLAFKTHDQTQDAMNAILNFQEKLKSDNRSSYDQQAAALAYQESKIEFDAAVASLLQAEARMRRLIGLKLDETQFLKPCDRPTDVAYRFQWEELLASAYAGRVELRKQAWRIERLCLQRRSADNLNDPSLDFSARYQLNGFGDELLGDDTRLNSAYGQLFRGGQTGWNVALDLSVPTGLRFAKSQVRNLDLRITRSRAELEAQRSEIKFDLAESYRQVLALERRRTSSRLRLEAAEELYKSAVELKLAGPAEGIGRISDRLKARIAHDESRTRYQQALAKLRYESGSIFEQHQIQTDSPSSIDPEDATERGDSL